MAVSRPIFEILNRGVLALTSLEAGVKSGEGQDGEEALNEAPRPQIPWVRATFEVRKKQGEDNGGGGGRGEWQSGGGEKEHAEAKGRASVHRASDCVARPRPPRLRTL